MARTSGIEWTDATFNPWWGCERVSPACARCYAEHLAKRWGHTVWGGDGSPRRFLSEAHWRAPLKWNRDAVAAGMQLKVFCASMADVFEDRADLEPWRHRLWELIESTPALSWQLLTKRPENVERMAPWSTWPANVWLGVSVENMRFTHRADVLREIPAAVRFISAEPLLSTLFGPAARNRRPLDLDRIDWMIAGGESGAGARPTSERWLLELRDACLDRGIAFFLKQLGGWPDKRGGAKALLEGQPWRELPAAA